MSSTGEPTKFTFQRCIFTLILLGVLPLGVYYQSSVDEDGKFQPIIRDNTRGVQQVPALFLLKRQRLPSEKRFTTFQSVPSVLRVVKSPVAQKYLSVMLKKFRTRVAERLDRH